MVFKVRGRERDNWHCDQGYSRALIHLGGAQSVFLDILRQEWDATLIDDNISNLVAIRL
jgi:hypothetical protein